MPEALRLALSLLTVTPVRAERVDRATATTAMLLAPVVGLLLGAIVAGAVLLAVAAGAPALVTGVLAVGLLALLTRGLHLDGLADTADGLGSYGDAERALAVMKKPDIGPFGVVAIAVALLAQAASIAALAPEPATAAVAILIAVATGRVAILWACRRGVPPARPDGLGALVAGSIPVPAAIVWTAAVAVAALAATPDRPWVGPIAVLAAAATVVALTGHTVRRLGGITGDVIGAGVEVATTVCLVVLTLG
jgi:adenosylcobinamide-GDP ribazoletransferase